MIALSSHGKSLDVPLSSEWRSTSRSHVGSVRAINEDRVFDCPDRKIWAVVDGMGGHEGGDVAAQTVVDHLRALSTQSSQIGLAPLLAALTEANAAIVARNATLGLNSGATVVAAAIDQQMVQIAWAGDSRAYLVRAGNVIRLTRDHSFVQELVDAGLLTAQAADHHPQSNVVTRALGVHDLPGVETICVAPRRGDRILLCSDGLSRSLAKDELSAAVPIGTLAASLLANALYRDGSDNVSLVLLEHDCNDAA